MNRTWRAAFLIIGPLAVVGGIIGLYCWSGIANLDVPLDHQFIPYQPGRGVALCQKLAAGMQERSTLWSVASWLMSFFSVVLLSIGGIIGSGPENARWWRKGAGVLLATIGGTLAASSAFAVARATAAASASANAIVALYDTQTHARLADDEESYIRCLEAKVLWLRSRSEALAQLPLPSTSKNRSMVPTAGAQPSPHNAERDPK